MRQNSGMVARVRPLGVRLAGLADKAAYGSRTALEDVMEFVRGIAVPAGIIALVLAFLALASGRAAADTPAAAGKAPVAASSKAGSKSGKFTLVSPDIGQGKDMSLDQVYNGFGCKGKNSSPALFWSTPPAGTQSFAMKYMPAGVVQGRTDFGTTAAMVGFAVNANKIAAADLVGLYGR